MCNLNVFVKKTGRDFTIPLCNATAHSFTRNNHGEGAFFSYDSKVLKSKEKINFYNQGKRIRRSRFVITHQRFATSGFSEEYTHPFVSDRWVLIHNGIFNRSDGQKSDTATFFEFFCKAFDEKKILGEAISKALDEVNSGSYSIFLYDRKDKCGYYFKGNGLSISVVKTKGGNFFITTDDANLIFVNVKTKYTIESKHLYQFLFKKGVPEIYDCGELKLNEPVYPRPTANTTLGAYMPKRGYNCGWSDAPYDSEEDGEKTIAPNDIDAYGV